MKSLKKVNFIYGENGSGKSTLAKCLSKSTECDLSRCKFDEHGEMSTYLYNSEFVKNVLGETNIKGVFTVGDNATEDLKLLNNIKNDIDKTRYSILKITEAIAEKNEEDKLLKSTFAEMCWKKQKEYQKSFEPIFKGFLNSKNSFMEKCIIHMKTRSESDIDSLKVDVELLYTKQPTKFELIEKCSVSSGDWMDYKAFSEKIIGKNESEYGRIIELLGNGDWVKQGILFVSDEVCPFCHQMLPTDFRKNFEDYFDKTYSEKIERLSVCIKSYIDNVDEIIKWLESIATINVAPQFFDYNNIMDKVELLKAKIRNNLNSLVRKRDNPSECVALEDIRDIFDDVKVFIDNANMKIAGHNSKVDNLSKERDKLKVKVWDALSWIIYPDYKMYEIQSDAINKGMEGLSLKHKGFLDIISKLNGEALVVNKRISSVQHVVDKINKILKSFGYTEFYIDSSKKDGYYSIVRTNGELAHKNLSEGEKTFIAFLYFYHLIQGDDPENETKPRVIVIDDPVSSLDSKILFVVSTLVRTLFRLDLLKKYSISQIFIFSHNLYFYKEVSFAPKKVKKYNILGGTDFKYWKITKKDGVSQIFGFNENPIRTSYELLWDDIRKHAQGSDVDVSLCNTLRRIIEYYFINFAGLGFDDIIDHFKGDERLVCRSLVSWLHDGSHHTPDGIDFSMHPELNDKYLDVFENIFKITNHHEHYKRMIGISS